MGLTRRRLTPEARQTLILDQASEIILADGLAAATMERLARDCGVSKGLVYSYFPSRNGVLAALLRREQAELRDRGMASALRADSFAELIRQTTRLYLQQTRDRGALIDALLADPSTARLVEADNRAERERTIRFFVRAARREFGLPLPAAIAAVDALMNLTGGAGRQVAEGALDVETATEMCVALIEGGLRELAARISPPRSTAARTP